MIRRSLPVVLSLLSLLLLAAGAAAAQPQWSLVKPSNTGIPGEAIETIQWAPNGDLWVGARWPNYEEGGIGVFDFETEIWSGWSNFETPLPSEYINDIDFDANGVIDDADFAVFNQAFGHSVGDPEYREEADFDDDGIVTLVDHQLFTAAMRSPCNPSPAGPQGCGLLGIEAALLVAAALARRRRRSGHA